MHMFRRLLVVATAFLLTQVPLRAQLVGGQWDTLHQFDGLTANDHLGNSVSGAGDVDGDGFDDLIVGAYEANPGGRNLAGSAYVYSGATGALLWQFDGPSIAGYLGSSVSGAGDVDGDGFADLIVGAPNLSSGGLFNQGTAFVYSGSTGALIWRFDGQASWDSLGDSVSTAGDVDGDGFDDLIVGASQASPGGTGSAYVYSGATGALVWQFDAVGPTQYLGCSVSSAGDVNGDGFDDVIVGAYGSFFGGSGYTGSAFVYSGATGTSLWQFDGQAGLDELGNSVSGAGDVDGDGFDDLIVGAHKADPGGLGGAGSAYVYSGATGSLIWQFDGQAAGDGLGGSVSGSGDIDGDGFDDLAIGAQGASPGGMADAGSAYVYSGATSSLIRQFDGQAVGDSLGASVSGAGDVDGDGVRDLIVGASRADPGGVVNAGSAYAFSLDPYLHMDAESISVSGSSTVQLGMDFPASEAGARYAVLASITGTGPIVMAGLEIPLTADNLFNLITSGNVPAPLQGAFGTLNANGQALATLSAGPALAPAIGQTVYFAAVTYDVGPLAGRMSSVVRYLQILP